MFFISAQPDELMFAWQTRVQLKNYENLGVNLKDVYVLIGYKTTPDNIETLTRWKDIQTAYPTANFKFYKDERVSKVYPSSIRPFLLKKFFEENPKLEDVYYYYCDSDTALAELPAFEAMQDYRWHFSPADYISWNYIDEKKSPSLMRDMLGSVGIPEQPVKDRQKNVGGVQYFIYGTSSEFWSKVEQDCERMWTTYHAHYNIYRREYFNNVLKLQDKYKDITFEEWRDFDESFKKNNRTKPAGKEDWQEYDFQIWCVDMWVIFWNALYLGVDVYVNPDMRFIWPTDKLHELDNYPIYHDAGRDSSSYSNKWLVKKEFKTKTPFLEDWSNKGYLDTGEPGAQRFYLDLITSIGDEIRNKKQFTSNDKRLVSCLMTTYGRFECVERSIGFWLDQDYSNKELVILNTAPTPLTLSKELQGKGIRIYNSETIHGTDTPYTNVGQVRADVLKLALGDYYICWDDDDAYLPNHISQGIEYIIQNNKKAYRPEYSLYTANGGISVTVESNHMEAACIVDINEIKKYGFKDSNGGEHLSWFRGIVDEGILDEHIKVKPTYMYIWGEYIAGHKQSGDIENPNNFENHKKASRDFGTRPLSFYSRIRLDWFYRIMRNVIG